MHPSPLTRRAFLARAATALAATGFGALGRPGTALAGSNPMALAFSWGDAAIADLPFADMFRSDHTLVLRFMPQYTHAYAAPLLSAGGFLVEQGDFFGIQPSGSTKLVVSAGSKRKTYPARIEPGRWYHLALVRSGDDLVVYLDGRQLRPPIDVDKARVRGPLRLGRKSRAAAQFYGLIDDVAIARRALTPARIRALAWARFLTGRDSDLTSVALGSGPQTVPVSASRDGRADLAMVPFGPVAPLLVPFPPGEAWEVIEGFDDPLGSHRGYAAFAWDLVLAGRPRAETTGRPFLAAAPGTVDRVVDEHGSGPPSWNYVSVRTGARQVCDYLHLVMGSAQVTKGEQVEAGRLLGAVGDTGVALGASHLHLAVTTLGEAARDSSGYVTIPASFGGYEVSDDAGQTWRTVAQGVPVAGQWVRRPAVDS
jgi:murein DD-endopeptidase MepM/ murein hydrolase activator NlpD